MSTDVTSRPLRLFLVATEESGDRLGAALIRALREATNGRIELRGIGGRAMAAEGLTSLFPIDDLAIVGFSAIPKRLPDILRRIREAADAAVAAGPDGLVIIDSPEFTHRVARRVRRRAPHIPIVDYVSPSVWAWRPGRARAMRAYVDRVLALLPFEPEEHRKLGGPPCVYVGHPLSEQVDALRPSPDEADRRARKPWTVLALPGSRRGEVERHAAVFGEALGLLAERVGSTHSLEVVVPTAPHLSDPVTRSCATWPVPVRVVTSEDDKRAAMRIARAALTKSGTVTLELALSGVPMVAAYRVSAIEALVARRLVRGTTVILANLVLGRNVVPEFLQDDCTPSRLADALAPLLNDTQTRQLQTEAFASLDAIMEIGREAPARRAAEAVLETLQRSELGFAGAIRNG